MKPHDTIQKEKISINLLTIHEFVQDINSGNSYAFTRYGDGEWASILGERGANCDKHEYFPELKKDLIISLEGYKFGSNYYMGMMGLALKVFKERIYNFLLAEKKLDKIIWYNSVIFSNAIITGKFKLVIDALNNKHNIIMVGPRHLKNLPVLKINKFIEIPEVNCYLEKDRILQEIKKYGERGIYCFSASMLSKVLIYNLFPLLSNSFLIDFGSIWEPFVGRETRSYQKGRAKELSSLNQ